ncbi:MAG TPA: DUF131 domain-containing protein [Thermoplasmata archaeon]|nr:DUF131 domain-containing protein [Thermoplasmata archaeon]
MRRSPVVAVLLTAAGVGLIALAVVQRTTQFALVVFVPVFLSNSWELPVGSLCLFGGIFAALVALAPEEPPGLEEGRSEVGRSGGGVVVIGPVPIFFGNLTRVSRRTRWAVTIGSVALFVALLVVYGLIR